MKFNEHFIIVGCCTIILILSSIICIMGRKKETFSPCVDSIDRNYDSIRCLPSQGFQDKCIRMTEDNQTVYPSYIPSACAQGESTLLSVGL